MGRDVHNRRWSEAQPPARNFPNKALQGRDYFTMVDNLVPAGLLIACGNCPAVALRSTAGYAPPTPAGLRTLRQNHY
ncbi:MAG: hypothetical protein LBL62_00065 [Planctomycetaceae bacterium]|nr:hypothetical protein [Planctomycetaceae bacterium]